MPTDLFTLTADLRALGGGRVWSLMISLFGDLAQGKGDAIAGPVLSQIMAGLGVKPEAARVALHRLRNDGWITSEKVGRISHHALTGKGRRESAIASPRIYADAGAMDWQMVLLQDADDAAPIGFTQVLPRLFVGPADTTLPEDALPLSGGAVPDWLRRDLMPEELLDGYETLHHILRRLAEDLPQTASLSPLDCAVLRCLIVHNWRRLVLKHPALPRALVDVTGPAHLCHVAVHDLLDRFKRPSLDAIAQEYAAL